MDIFLTIFLYSSLSGLAIIIGGYLGTKKIPDKIFAFVLSFGSGVLISVLAYTLMHEAYRHSGPIFTSVAFMVGGLVFYAIEELLIKKFTPGLGLILGTALDDLPEALSMGIGFASNTGRLGMVLALSIFLHNIPEGISSTAEMIKEGNFSSKSALTLTILLALLEPLAALTGYYLLRNIGETWLGMIMAFSGGSILFMTGTDMIPKAHKIGDKIDNIGLLTGFLAAFLLSRLM